MDTSVSHVIAYSVEMKTVLRLKVTLSHPETGCHEEEKKKEVVPFY